jgi:hypothetical protein
MLTGLDTSPAHDTDSAPYGVGSVNALVGVTDVAIRSAWIDRRFEPTVTA